MQRFYWDGEQMGDCHRNCHRGEPKGPNSSQRGTTRIAELLNNSAMLWLARSAFLDCKTSTPGSNPGGASTLQVRVRWLSGVPTHASVDRSQAQLKTEGLEQTIQGFLRRIVTGIERP